MRRVIVPEVIFRHFGIWVVVCVGLMLADWRVNLAEVTGPVERGMFGLQAQMQRVGQSTGRPVAMLWYWDQGLQRIADLEQRLNDVVIDKARLAALEEEVESLRVFAGVEQVVEGEVLEAEVISTVDGVTVSQGYVAGLEGGEMVVDNAGLLVGVIDEVGKYSSRVQTPESLDNRIAVALAGKDIRAVMVGDGGGVELQELLQEAEVVVGDVVVTSGADGRYPAGLVVAQVVEVEGLSSAVTKVARAELLRDLEGLVFIYK